MNNTTTANSMMPALLSSVLILALLVGWGFAIAIFGYPAIILPALGLTFAGLVGLIFVTRG